MRCSVSTRLHFRLSSLSVGTDMKISLVSTFLLATGVIARSPQHANKKLPERLRREPAGGLPPVGLEKRASKKHHILPQNKNTTSMAVTQRRRSSRIDNSQNMPSTAPRFLMLISTLARVMLA